MENLAFRCLGIAKIHHFVQQFVDNDKVIPDTFLLQDLEIFGEHLHDLVEEQEDFGSICVSLGQREDIEIAMTNIEVLRRAIVLSKLEENQANGDFESRDRG